jgi:hypothetical protein
MNLQILGRGYQQCRISAALSKTDQTGITGRQRLGAGADAMLAAGAQKG